MISNFLRSFTAFRIYSPASWETQGYAPPENPFAARFCSHHCVYVDDKSTEVTLFAPPAAA